MVFKHAFWISVIVLTFVAATAVAAQGHHTIQGSVRNEKQEALPGATVILNGQQTATSQADGSFYFSSVHPGKYTLTVSAVGYSPHEQEVVQSAGQTLRVDVILHTDVKQVSEVTVIGKTETQQVREQAIRAVVVDTRAVAEQPVTLAELMNRAPGIRIRQSGGLGNQVDVSVNGFQGNSVQYFRDGIPLEYLGGGYGINNVPINLLERVEVYRGVVPISLGGDALGGAVNLVTRRNVGTTANVSYEVASFNTHIANLSLYHHQKDSHWFVGADAFFNYSDNDYKVNVEVVNEDANLVPATVRLFHNAYKHHFAEAYAGVKNTAWAGEFRLSVATYELFRESQHPARMTDGVYGAVTLKNRGIVPSLHYKKSILENTLSLEQFLSYSITKRNRVDTVKGSYDWFGDFTPRLASDLVGESRNPSLSDIDFTNIISRTHISYKINETHSLETNLVFNHNRRLGKDPHGLRFAGTDIDVLSKEAVYQKIIAGIAWESKWWNDKLSSQLYTKYFGFQTKGINAFLDNDRDLDNYTSTQNHNWGIGEGLKYQINGHSFVRLSAELTNRLPRIEELFGDNDTRAPNFDLEPERSFNVNVGYRYTQEKYAVEIGGFYRKTQGMILLIPIQAPYAQFQNLDSVRGFGFDIDAVYRLNKNIEWSGNLTWQDNRMVDIGTPLHQWIEGTRLRNTPYFFANLGLTGNYQGVFGKNDLLRPYIHYNFIREFYLNHIPRDKEPQGFLGVFGKSGAAVTNLIPDQSLVTAGFSYTPPSVNIIFGAEVKNLLDADLYDFYKIQRPGRSFHFKINYRFTK